MIHQYTRGIIFVVFILGVYILTDGTQRRVLSPHSHHCGFKRVG